MVNRKTQIRTARRSLREAGEKLAKHGSAKPPLLSTFRRKTFGPVLTFTAPLRSRIYHFRNWLQAHQRQHFGPTCRLPDLFQRRDLIYHHMSTEKLRWHVRRPFTSHGIFDVAAKVLHIEEVTGYTFKDRMTIIEALKNSGSDHPLYFNGTVHPVEKKGQRLALLGDRVLSMVLCDIWFDAERKPGEYARMSMDMMARKSLAAAGRKLKIHECIILNIDLEKATDNQVAETFEAVLGAVYVDSKKNIQAVTKVIKHLKLDQHEVLRRVDDKEPVSDVVA